MDGCWVTVSTKMDVAALELEAALPYWSYRDARSRRVNSTQYVQRTHLICEQDGVVAVLEVGAVGANNEGAALNASHRDLQDR